MQKTAKVFLSLVLLSIGTAATLAPRVAEAGSWAPYKANPYIWDYWGSWHLEEGPFPTLIALEAGAIDWCMRQPEYLAGSITCEIIDPGTTVDPAIYQDTYGSYYSATVRITGGNSHTNLPARWYISGYWLAPPDQPSPSCPTNETNPCDPANGNKSQAEPDYASAANGGLTFARFYNSSGRYKSGQGMGAGWRHTYSRAVDEYYDGEFAVSVPSSGTQSSQYSSASEACTSGWGDIKDVVFSGDLAAAVPVYGGGDVCEIESGGATAAYFPIRTDGEKSLFVSNPNFHTVTRPNGASHLFEYDGIAWVNKLNPSLRFEQSGTGWIYTDTNGTKETFDSAGRLASIDHRNGQRETLEYNLTAAQGGDDNGDTLDRVTGPFGHAIAMGNDGNGRFATVTTPDGVIQYAYDAAGNLSKVTYPDTAVREYHYEDPSFGNHLTGITDENLDRFATWAFDTEGRASSSEHAGGKELVQLAYNANGTTTLTMANGASRTYTFSTQQGSRKSAMLTGDVCSTCPGGDIADRTFDANGFLDSVFDWNGNETQTIRNSVGLTETLIEAKGSTEQRTTTTTWHPTFRIPTQIVSPKNTTDFTYDADGNALTMTVSSGALTRAWTMTYNTDGQPLTIDGSRTDVTDLTTIAYYTCTTGNECGQISTITNALSQVTTYNSYDAAGRPTLVTDANGLQTSFTYDTRGNVLTVTQSPTVGSPRTTTMSYDAVGQLETLSTPDGMVLTYAYSAAHYLASVTDNLGNYIRYDYDAMGNLIDEDTYDSGSVLERALDYAYDLNNRLDTITNGGFLSDLSIDSVGNLTNEIDPELASTTHNYDALNRLDQTIDALTGVIDFGYDDHDNVTSVVAANGATTTYVYDDLDNLTQEISADRGTITYTYDEAGNRKTELDARGKLTSYDYDPLNRLTLVTLNGAGTIAYEYDVGLNAIGRLDKITDSSGNTAWTYDNFGAVTQKVQTIGAATLTTGYGYDTSGRLSTMTYPSGKVVTYGYNTFLPVSVSVDGNTILSGATYDPFGPVNGWTWGNSSAHTRAYDLRGLLTDLTLGGDNRNLLYDAAGQITNMADESLDLQMGYDPLGRVTSFEALDTSGSYWLALAEVSAPDTVFLQMVTVTPGAFVWAPTMPTVPGEYELRLFETGGFNRIFTSATVCVEESGPPSSNASIDISASSANAGDPITAVMTDGPGNAFDWLAFAPVGSSDLIYWQWTYVAPGETSATWQINMPNSDDDYEFRLFEDDGYTRLATSPAVTVAGDPGVYPPAIEVSAEEVNGGALVTATMTGGPGNDLDWLALAPVGSSDSSYLDWTYVDPFATSFIWQVNMPTASDQYEFRLLENNGYRLLAASDPVIVLGGSANVRVSETVVGPGDTLTVTVISSLGPASGFLPDLQSFTYDANGNRTTFTEDGNSYNYGNQADSNQLLSTTGPTAKTYSYDAAGTVVSDGVHDYSYDDRARLVDVDAGAVTYEHNGQGQRVKKDDGTVTLFAYDEAGQVIGEYDSLGVAVQETAWFNGTPVAVLQGTNEYYVHTDQLGTPRAITDGNTVIWRWESDPFGSSSAQEDPDGDLTLFTYNLRFPGQYYDAETGLHYNYFRTYDPSTGRYLESDPVGLLGGLNTYGYVGGNPLSFTDSLGLAFQRICKHFFLRRDNQDYFKVERQPAWTSIALPGMDWTLGPDIDFGTGGRRTPRPGLGITPIRLYTYRIDAIDVKKYFISETARIMEKRCQLVETDDCTGETLSVINSGSTYRVLDDINRILISTDREYKVRLK